MKIQILFFGHLIEITGKAQLEVLDIYDTDSLIKKMLNDYPKLKDFKYLVSVEKKLVTGNQKLEPSDEVAFLPPFSGG